jgi:hypothetical protein
MGYVSSLAFLVEEVAIFFREVRLGLLDSEGETETRSVPNVDEAVFDHGIRQAIHDVIPPFGLALGIFESDVVLRQRRAHMHLRSDAEYSVENSVRSYQDPVEIGVLGDPLQFGDPAHILRVRPDHLPVLAFSRHPFRKFAWKLLKYNCYTLTVRFHFDRRKSERLRGNLKSGIGFEEALELFSHSYYAG